MGPLLRTISPEVPGSLGEPASGSALCLGMAGLPGGLGAALRAAVSEGLATGSQGSKGSIFGLFWGQLPAWERKQKDPFLARNDLLPAVPFPMAQACGKDPLGGDPHGWVFPNPSFPPGAQKGPGAFMP